MSYSRFSADSDVYVFHNFDQQYECCACKFADHRSVFFANPHAMINHLQNHRRTGDLVPQEAIEELKEEQRTLQRND